MNNIPEQSKQPAIDKSIDYQAAIDMLRKCASKELDGGYRSHHNALIYAANVLENEQAFGKEADRES